MSRLSFERRSRHGEVLVCPDGYPVSRRSGSAAAKLCVDLLEPAQQVFAQRLRDRGNSRIGKIPPIPLNCRRILAVGKTVEQDNVL
jgi:hypothetical protein